jgi:hypothetical protein
MTEPSIPAELTLRDVLSQVDRRLTLIEADVRDLDGRLDGLRIELKGDMAALGAELRADMGSLRTELRSDTDSLRADLLNRMDSRFTWSIATTVAIGGILLAAIKI